MQRTKAEVRRARQPLSNLLKKCLGTVLNAELSGEPLLVDKYRAQHPKKVPLLEALTAQRLIKRDQRYVATFWGLIRARSRTASAALKRCEKVYKVLGKHYSEHQYAALPALELERLTGLTAEQVAHSVLFLERSSASPAIGPNWKEVGVVGTEQYVTQSFRHLKEETRRLNSVAPMTLPALAGTIDYMDLFGELDAAESEPVRSSWVKAMSNITSDAAGAITAARALLESACRHVLAEFQMKGDDHGNLGKLYRDAASCIDLASKDQRNEMLKRLLAGCTTVVDGLSQLRNQLGDSHGRGPISMRPAHRHAALAVTLAGGLSAFLLATLDARRKP
jgi:hypothetical protein